MSKFVAISIGYPSRVFHFDTCEEYQEKAEVYKKQYFVEEWSIEVLESDAPQCYQDKINQNNIEFWLEHEDLAADNPIAAEFLIGLSSDWQDNFAADIDKVMVYTGKIEEYEQELAEDCTIEDERGKYWDYIDWERVALDGEYNGDYVEIQTGEWVINANSF